MRQIREIGIDADVTVATSVSQQDSVIAQLGEGVSIVTEPSRRDTFPAICLACEYLAKEKQCAEDEIVVVMPCDPYTETGYFGCIKRMVQSIADGCADMMVMGICPTYPSEKYGYVVPEKEYTDEVIAVKRFTEKPDVQTAEKLIADGALWNGGVFAFRLRYLTAISDKYVSAKSFTEVRDRYDEFPKISFDYEVAEKATSIGMVKFLGKWKDLGTWNTLTDELHCKKYGNVLTDDTCENTHIFNELGIPLLCLGTKDLVIAASPDGIFVSEKSKSENIKGYAAALKNRPMYEERRWGKYKIVDSVCFPDGSQSLTKHVSLDPDCSISYHRHDYHDEVWTIIDGEGEIVIDGVRRKIKRGDTVEIPKGFKHGVHALTSLSFIEVQTGTKLSEEDIYRFSYD